MRTDVYGELYLWNKNVDSLVRVLQRIELLGICPKQLLKMQEARLEELRSALNTEILEAILPQECIEYLRSNEQRTAWEQAASSEPTH